MVQGVPESTAGPPKVDNDQGKRPPRAIGISKKSKQLSISVASGRYQKNLPRQGWRRTCRRSPISKQHQEKGAFVLDFVT